MPVVQWDDSFIIGHDLIDSQHKRLFELTGNLYNSLAAEEPLDIRMLLLELYKYTIFHFSEEEALMRKTNYPDLCKHVAEHNTFTDVLDKLAKKAKHDDISIEVDVLNWLVSWLVSHISMSDRKLVRCLKQ
jgi:hemerythrin